MIKPTRVVRIPWVDVKNEYDQWIKVSQGESYVVTHIVKHAEELIEPGVRLAGIEVSIPGYGRVDLVFLKKGDYFVVEAKDVDEDAAREEAENYAKGLKEHLDQNGLRYSGITPVAAVIGYPKDSRYGFEVGGVLQKIDEETKRLLLRLVEQARARGIKLDQKKVVGKAIEYVYERGAEFFNYLTKKKEDRITTFLSPVPSKPGDVVKEHDLIAGE